MPVLKHSILAAAVLAVLGLPQPVFSAGYPNDKSGISCNSATESSKVEWSVSGASLAQQAVGQKTSPASTSCPMDTKYSSIQDGGSFYRGITWNVIVADFWVKGKDYYVCSIQYNDADHPATCHAEAVYQDRDFNGPIINYK